MAANDTLEFWHPRADIKVPDDFFDWGLVAPGSSQDRDVRVRNVSATYTALGVMVSLEELGIYDPALPVPAQHFLSLDGSTFTATVTVGDLAPLVISDLVTVRRVTARLADVGPGEFQLSAKAADWT